VDKQCFMNYNHIYNIVFALSVRLAASVNDSVDVLLVNINYLRCTTVCFIKVIAILESSSTDEQILFVAICTLKPEAVRTDRP